MFDELDKASSVKLLELAGKLDMQLTMLGELRLRDAEEAKLVVQIVKRAAGKAFSEGR